MPHVKNERRVIADGLAADAAALAAPVTPTLPASLPAALPAALAQAWPAAVDARGYGGGEAVQGLG